MTISCLERTITEMSRSNRYRLGFPEWTIWTLPLTARGFGYVVLRQHQYDLEKYIKDEISNGAAKAHMQDYLADAFATYAMGPAYACAATLWRFNPFPASVAKDDQLDNAKRAHVVFTMLKRMNRKTKFGVYTLIIKQLEDEWNEALKQARSSTTLQNSDKEQLESLVHYLWNYLEKETLVLYPNNSWSCIRLAQFAAAEQS